MSDPTPIPWLPVTLQDGTPDAFQAGRVLPDVRTTVDLATGMYTDLDTGQIRTWWEQRMYVQARNMTYARALAEMRQVNSDQQNLWGRKPHFHDNWFDGYIPEYRLANPRADLRNMNELYGGPGPWPNGPLPGGGY